MSNNLYIYSIIRKDIPLADQIVQTAHSAFHAGEKYGTSVPDAIPSLILLEVANQEELLALAKKLDDNEIGYSMFFEPDDDFGNTSLTTMPLNKHGRKLFSNLRLWRP